MVQSHPYTIIKAYRRRFRQGKSMAEWKVIDSEICKVQIPCKGPTKE
jgi:hypothetical protein